MLGYSLAPQVFDSILESLGQGFLLFGRDGMCLPFYSAACKHLLDVIPANKSIEEVLRIPEHRRQAFTQWYQLLFEDRFVFEEIADLGPRTVDHILNKHIALEFKPVRSPYGGIDFVLVMATDRSAEVAAIKRSEELQVFADMVLVFLRDRTQFRLFVEEGKRLIENAQKLPLVEQEASRNLHTLKAVAGTIKAKPLIETIHSLELSLRGEYYPELRLRMLADGLKQVQSEFNRLINSMRDLTGGEDTQAREIADAKLQDFEKLLVSGSVSHKELLRFYREQILWTPIRTVMRAYDQVLAEAAARLGKIIQPIQFTGDNPPIFRAWHETVWMALPNLFRNIMDHGIETPEIRRSRGKPEAGKVSVHVQGLRSGNANHLLIAISDDGSGLDVEALKEKLRASGRAEFADKASDKEIMNCVFDQGISTNMNVSQGSGMGLGMTAVKQAVAKYKGLIQADSVPGQGATFTVTLPLPKID